MPNPRASGNCFGLAFPGSFYPCPSEKKELSSELKLWMCNEYLGPSRMAGEFEKSPISNAGVHI